MTEVIGVFNAGSSSLKFAFYRQADLALLYKGKVDNIITGPGLRIQDSSGATVFESALRETGHAVSLHAVLDWLEKQQPDLVLKIAGHRIVHGKEYTRPMRVTPQLIEELKTYIPLAPLHQPHNLHSIEILSKLHPALPQIACFDTAFHRTQSRLAEMFALPRQYYEEGVRRYGFHGLSYEYITSELKEKHSTIAQGGIIIAHLGNGASLCAIKHAQSKASSMGFTALDGLMMGTRCGTLDPGVILYLQQEKKMSAAQIETLLYEQSGLKGVSGITHDMRELLASKKPEAAEAIELYCLMAARQVASLSVEVGGLEALVFTAGIGENQPYIRNQICNHLRWLGVSLDEEKNTANATIIHHEDSTINVLVIPTDEEHIVARHCRLA